MNHASQTYWAAGYRMLGRSDMSRKLGNTRRAIRQAWAASRLFLIAARKL